MLALTSDAIVEGQPIPTRFTCDGADISPPLRWAGLPAGAVSLAVLVDDPGAPGGTFTHWLAWDLDPAAGAVEKGVAPPAEGRNGFGRSGYGGPCPPRGDGPHRYAFRVFALDAALDLDPGASEGAFRAALVGHVLGAGELTGTYERD